MKKLFAMLLALVMVLSLVACGDGKDDAGSGDASGDTGSGDAATVTAKTVHKFLVFNNTCDGLTTEEVVWAPGKDAKYNGYSLKAYLEKNGCPLPADDVDCWFVAGSDMYASTGAWGEQASKLYVAIEDTVGKGRTPITCGEANDTAKPFNCELIVLGETAIFFLDVAGSSVGTVSGWMGYMNDAEIPFDECSQYTFTMKDGTTKTVAKADVDTVALADVVSMVAG